jgi:hypothetical protein
MNQNSNVASLFQKHATKKAAAAFATSNHSLDPVEPMVEE